MSVSIFPHKAKVEVEEDRSQAAAARTGGTGAEKTRRSSTPIVNPFDGRPSQSSIPKSSPVKSDGTMEDVSGDFGTVMNAPELPKPPRYKGSAMQERRDFLRAYNTYFAALRTFQTELNRPFVQPVDVTEDESVPYFLQSKQTSFEHYAALDVDMQKLIRNTTLAEAESRVNRLQANLYKILENHHMVDIKFQLEQKELAKYLVTALAPATFKAEVQRRIDQEQNKKYKADIFEFSRWLTSLLASFIFWKKPLLQPTGFSKLQHQNSTQNIRRGNSPSNAANPPNSAAASSKPTPQRQFQSREHRVRDGPLVQPGEANQLCDEFHASRQHDTKETKPPAGAMKRLIAADCSSNGPGTVMEQGDNHVFGDHGTVDATVLGLTVQASLLDSGAGASSVSSLN
ncbi:unnamed protein product [Phytophthora fragariaefolia]|uniref:Unnamed protein product n=1 Tax=Phytophthora fragariaefolia TaxID=1490495 RepID=A0A9W6XMC9_9STRA|nr:unnamed protein product [Phytophthora fragariaefolia]